jgi:hypothetical protein
MQHMIVIRNNKKEYRLKVTGPGLPRRRAMPTEHQTVANLRQLVSETSNLARSAREGCFSSARLIVLFAGTINDIQFYNRLFQEP